MVNAWYSGQAELTFDPNTLAASDRNRFRLSAERFPIAEGDRGGVPIILAFSPETGILDCSGQFGKSQPLVTALLLNQQAEVVRLLESGVDPNRINEEGWAPVHLAATLSNESALALLRAQESNINLRGSRDWTPLHFASTRGNLSAAEVLFERRLRTGLLSNRNETALMPAIRSADLEYIEFLLNSRKYVFLSEGRSPGIEVINNHRDDLVSLLVRERAVPTLNRDTADLVLAQLIQFDRVELVRMQIEGQNLSVRRQLGEDWPIMLAASNASLEMVELLHQHGAQLDVDDSNGRTALHLAVSSNASVIPWLIQHGLDPNALTASGWSPLGIALLAENINAVVALLHGGADPNIEVGEGYHLLWLATRLAQRQTVSHLVQAGAICEFTPEGALELLEDAFRYDIPEVFDITLAQCIDVDFEFSGGFPGWGVADRYEAHRIQALMLDKGLSKESQRELKLVSHHGVEQFEPQRINFPTYPYELALKYGPQTVLVNVVIGRDGKPRFPVFLENPVPELKDEIVARIQNWSFVVEGIPESAHGISVTVPLRLKVEEKIFELAELTKSPSPIDQRTPRYPPRLLERRIEGLVTLRFVIDQNGRVSEDRIQVERTAHPELTRSAINAVKNWVFEPGELNGEAVSCWVRVEIPFIARR